MSDMEERVTQMKTEIFDKIGSQRNEGSEEVAVIIRKLDKKTNDLEQMIKVQQSDIDSLKQENINRQ